MKTILRKIFDLFGYVIVKKKTYLNLFNKINNSDESHYNYNYSMKAGLERAFNWNIKPSTIIDVGAATGSWSINAKKIWKDSAFVLFEPLKERKDILNNLASLNENFYVIHKGAGDKKDKIDFYVTEDLDGSGIADNNSNARKIQIEITTLDSEIENLNLKPPYVIKLDTHGYEVPILNGAENLLKNTHLLIIECYGYQIAPNSLLFWEMCSFLEKRNFRLVSIVDVSIRPKDNTFWQCDAFFIPSYSDCFQHNTYHI